MSTCSTCGTEVIENGLIVPRNTDGSLHMECFDKRWTFERTDTS